VKFFKDNIWNKHVFFLPLVGHRKEGGQQNGNELNISNIDGSYHLKACIQVLSSSTDNHLKRNDEDEKKR